MKVFVYEYCCARPETDAPVSSLHAEGRAMLLAVTDDLRRMNGIEVVTAQTDEMAHIQSLAATADFTLVIAPEIDGILEARARWVEAAGGRVLGPTPDAIRITADKLALAELLGAKGIACPPTVTLSHGLTRSPDWYPVVCKPRFGAGSWLTRRVHTRDELTAVREPGVEFVMQPEVPGTPASVAFLLGEGGHVTLLPARQHLSDDDYFQYLGGEAPLPADLSERAVTLATRAVEAVHGLRGYVGVDLVLGVSPSGESDRVIEINPRLTTSYVGLRRLAKDNLMHALIQTMRGEPPVVRWRESSIRWKVTE
jgi:predicted ATP-grasp superfamily ATP-dependent carboligase